MFVLQDDVGADNSQSDDSTDGKEGSYGARTEDEESRHDAE